MIIDEANRIHSQDTLLRGFTYQDVLDTAQANGEPVYKTFRKMLRECEAIAIASMHQCVERMNYILDEMNRRDK